MTLRTLAMPYGPLSWPVPLTVSWICGCSPNPVNVVTM